jgi:chaperonin GroES
MKIKPVGERVILKTIPSEEKTKSGIYIPKSEDKKQGIVEEVGQIKDDKSGLKKGDRVLYAGYSSEEFEFEGEKFLIVEYKDIIAILGN